MAYAVNYLTARHLETAPPRRHRIQPTSVRPLLQRRLGPCSGSFAYQFVGPVQQWLAAEPVGDVAGLADDLFGGFGVTQASEVLGIFEQSVSQVVRGARLAQAVDGGRGDAPTAGLPSLSARRARTRSRSDRCTGASWPGGQLSSMSSNSRLAAVSLRSCAARTASGHGQHTSLALPMTRT